jgi:hypothetical protein
MTFLISICRALLQDKELDVEALRHVPEETDSSKMGATKEVGWDPAFALAQEAPVPRPMGLQLSANKILTGRKSLIPQTLSQS